MRHVGNRLKFTKPTDYQKSHMNCVVQFVAENKMPSLLGEMFHDAKCHYCLNVVIAVSHYDID